MCTFSSICVTDYTIITFRGSELMYAPTKERFVRSNTQAQLAEKNASKNWVLRAQKSAQSMKQGCLL